MPRKRLSNGKGKSTQAKILRAAAKLKARARASVKARNPRAPPSNNRMLKTNIGKANGVVSKPSNKIFIDNVVNPVHTPRCARAISLGSANGLGLIDYITFASNMTENITVDSVSLTIRSVMFALAYGSTNTQTDILQENSQEAYRVWYIPFASTGESVFDDSASPQLLPWLEFTNYQQNQSITNTMQLMGGMIQVKPMVSMVTDAENTQFLSGVVGGCVKVDNFFKETVSDIGNNNAYRLVKTGIQGTDFNNDEGCTVRYFYGEHPDQANYYDTSTLTQIMNSELDTQPFDSSIMSMPFIHVTFNQDIVATAAAESRINYLRKLLSDGGFDLKKELVQDEVKEPLKPTFGVKHKRQQDIMDRKIDPKRQRIITEYLEKLTTELEEIKVVLGDDLLSGRSLTTEHLKYRTKLAKDIRTIKNILDGSIGIPIEFTVVYPLKFFARVLIDAGVVQPTSLTVSPNPSDGDFWRVFVWLKQNSLNGRFPLVTDGHSFRSVLNKIGKVARSIPRYIGDGIDIASQVKRQAMRAKQLF